MKYRVQLRLMGDEMTPEEFVAAIRKAHDGHNCDDCEIAGACEETSGTACHDVINLMALLGVYPVESEPQK